MRIPMYVDRDMMLQSDLYWKLPKSAQHIYWLIRGRSKGSFLKRKKGHKEWMRSNDGEIEFTYREAHKKFGISQASFTIGISILVEWGFIFIGHAGGGYEGDSSKYGLSDQWRNYGTDKFNVTPRKKDSRKLSFTKENWEQRTGRTRKSIPA